MDRGAHFYRCDLQVHSPRDRAWAGTVPVADEEREAYARSLIKACRERGVQAVAITDHHDFAFVPYVRKAAAQERAEDGSALADKERVVVFPGLELTLAVPCQALLLLDADFPDEWFDTVLTALAIAPHPATEAKGPEVKRLAFDSIGQVVESLDKQTVLRGRYIVLPNVSDGGGSTLIRKGMAPKYVSMPCVGGYVDGGVSGLGDGCRDILAGRNSEWGNKPLGVFQTSDSRREDHSTLGDPSTWVKWAVPTAEALRQACLARQSRISVDEPQLPSTFIQSVSVSNSKFLGPFDVELNPQYSAFIGGRGTGKSTALEYLRWALCDQPASADEDGESPDYQLRRDSLIAKTLRPFGSVVEVRFVVNGVHHVVRRQSSDGRLLLKIAGGEFEPATEAQIRSLVSIQAYSQKQLSSVAIRIDELTRFLEAPGRSELVGIDQGFEKLSAKIREVHAERLEYRLIRRSLSEEQRELTSLRQQAESIRDGLSGLTEEQQQLISQSPAYQEAEQIAQGLLRDVQVAIDALTAADERLSGLPRARSITDEPTEWNEVEQLRSTVTTLLQEARSSNSALLERLRVAVAEDGSISQLLLSWRESHDRFNDRYEGAKAASQTHQSRLQELTAIDRRISELATSADQAAARLDALGDPEHRYRAQWGEWLELHQKRLSVLQRLADRLAELSSDLIRAQLRVAGDTTTLIGRLKDLVRGSGIHSTRLEEIVAAVLAADDPIQEWLDLVGEFESVATWSAESSQDVPLPNSLSRASIGASQIEKLGERLTADGWLDFALRPLRPVPVFEFEAREGDFIPFADASAGQQATALLKALLSQDGPPLIIDQPEDDLDNQVVLEIVEDIWGAKARRQLIFASHNANLVVNGDAELVVSFDYRVSGDASGGKIATEGAIDVPETNAVIKRVMEGGAEAFKLRRDKYGF